MTFLEWLEKERNSYSGGAIPDADYFFECMIQQYKEMLEVKTFIVRVIDKEEKILTFPLNDVRVSIHDKEGEALFTFGPFTVFNTVEAITIPCEMTIMGD